jgi:hypothetical protein
MKLTGTVSFTPYTYMHASGAAPLVSVHLRAPAAGAECTVTTNTSATMVAWHSINETAVFKLHGGDSGGGVAFSFTATFQSELAAQYYPL